MSDDTTSKGVAFRAMPYFTQSIKSMPAIVEEVLGVLRAAPTSARFDDAVSHESVWRLMAVNVLNVR